MHEERAGAVKKKRHVLSYVSKIENRMQPETQVSGGLCKVTNTVNKNIFYFESHPHPHNVNRVLAANSSSVPEEAFFIQKKYL